MLHQPELEGPGSAGAPELTTNELTGSARDGSFVSFVNPPANSPTKQFGRDIIFLIDRSGSMYGSPFENACNGLDIALESLKSGNNDRFGIVCFNHLQRYFNPHKLNIIANSMLEEIGSGSNAHGDNINPRNRNQARQQLNEFDGGIGSINAPSNYNLSLFEASDDNIKKGKLFVKDNYATGGTDIYTPLMWALTILNNYNDSKNSNAPTTRKRVPFIVLLTDGAVANERQIVIDCEKFASNVRVLTFGIGKYCNWYFLKLLALRSRGWQDGAMYRFVCLLCMCFVLVLVLFFC